MNMVLILLFLVILLLVASVYLFTWMPDQPYESDDDWHKLRNVTSISGSFLFMATLLLLAIQFVIRRKVSHNGLLTKLNLS